MRCQVIWSECPECGRKKWVPLKYAGGLCNACSLTLRARPKTKGIKRPNASAKQRGALNHNWKGGRKKHRDGYVYVKLTPDDPMYEMAGNEGYVLEHRLAVARAIGRPLKPSERVHHRDGDKAHNDIANLELWFGGHPTGIRAADHHCPGCRCFEGEGAAHERSSTRPQS